MNTPLRLSLARLPTPIELLKHTSALLKKEVYIWRDDLNGFIDSGNKLRKLEFLVADALAKGCDTLITCGGPQSNHTRATAAIARKLGLSISILILPKPGFDHKKPASANLLLNQILGAKITWLDYEEFQKRGEGYAPFLKQEADTLVAQGKKPYVIPLGGSNAIGCLGYDAAIKEMLPVWKSLVSTSNEPDHLFCALGSGGTFTGLQLGVQNQKIKTRLHGVNVIGPLATAQNYVSQLVKELAATGTTLDTSNTEVIDGYVGEGYAIASDADLRFYAELARQEGILLDPCYTGKAFQGMVSEIKKQPERFGDKILFLHSGGIFGTFAYAEQYQKTF